MGLKRCGLGAVAFLEIEQTSSNAIVKHEEFLAGIQAADEARTRARLYLESELQPIAAPSRSTSRSPRRRRRGRGVGETLRQARLITQGTVSLPA